MNNTHSNAPLDRAQQDIDQLSALLHRKHIRRFLQLYGVFAEFRHSSLREKARLCKRALFKLLKKPVVVHARADCAIWTQISSLLQDCSVCLQQLRGIGDPPPAALLPSFSDAPADLAVYDRIAQAKAEGKRVVCIMAPMFSTPVIDGYFRRIKTIDDLMGENTLKIYMAPTYNSAQGDQLSQVVDPCHIKVSYRADAQEDRAYLRKLADRADIVYHHGVGYMDEEIIRKKHLLKIVDLHGVLPEEFAMYKDYRMVQKETLHEELAMRYANYVICVTEAMQEHMEKKYPQYKQNYIILPILDDSVYENYKKPWPSAAADSQTPVVVYAGGMQEWQMIPEMQACMRAQPGLEYRVFTAQQERFWELWRESGDSAPLAHMCVSSASAQELWSEYEKCQYGFVLRQDMVVNHVACPTKLIEYITKGIIPIVSTKHLGDFEKKGLKCLSVEDFCQGKLLDEELRSATARHNKRIVGEIMAQHTTGKETLCRVMEGL